MDVYSVVEKTVDLSALNLKDPKARRLFILVNGDRTLKELYELCKFDKNSGDEVLQALLDGKYVNVIGHQVASTVKPVATAGSFTVTAGFIEKLTNEMTDYVGPIASILVENAVSPGQNFTNEELDTVLTTLSDSLETSDEKEQFLIKMRS